MDRGSRAFLFFPIQMLLFLGGLIIFAPTIIRQLEVTVINGYIMATALCASWAAHTTSLAILLGGCLLSCGLALSFAFGIYRFRQLIVTTDSFVSKLLFSKLDTIPERLIPALQRLHLEGRVDVVAVSHPYAFCYGLRRPRVCISLGLIELLSTDELSAILYHERHHLKRHDPLKVLFARSLTSAFFYLPIVRDFEHHFILWSEICADKTAVKEQGSRSHLASALYRLLTRPVGEAFPPNLAVGAFEATVQRIDHLLGLNSATLPRLSPSRIIASLLSLGVVAGALGFISRSSAVPSGICLVPEYLDSASFMNYAMVSPSVWVSLASVAACSALMALARRTYTSAISNRG